MREAERTGAIAAIRGHFRYRPCKLAGGEYVYAKKL